MTSRFALTLCLGLVGCAVGVAEDDDDAASSTAASALGVLPACPTGFTQYTFGTRAYDKSNEASGLAASRKNAGVLWTHDDSGDAPRVFAMTYAGDHLGVYNIANAGFVDWEDMGIGLVAGAWHLFLADIGGNDPSPRQDVQVYVVPEPNVHADQAPVTKTVTGTRRLQLHYPDGPHNAESIFVDPVDGALYVVTKSYDGLSKIFKKPAPHVTGTSTLALVAAIDFSKAPLFTANERTRLAATGADIAPDGSEILVKTKQVTFLWRRPTGSTVAQAFATPPCPMPNGVGEAIAFAPSGKHFFTTAEEAHSDVLLFYRD